MCIVRGTNDRKGGLTMVFIYKFWSTDKRYNVNIKLNQEESATLYYILVPESEQS